MVIQILAHQTLNNEYLEKTIINLYKMTSPLLYLHILRLIIHKNHHSNVIVLSNFSKILSVKIIAIFLTNPPMEKIITLTIVSIFFQMCHHLIMKILVILLPPFKRVIQTIKLSVMTLTHRVRVETRTSTLLIHTLIIICLILAYLLIK